MSLCWCIMSLCWSGCLDVKYSAVWILFLVLTRARCEPRSLYTENSYCSLRIPKAVIYISNATIPAKKNLIFLQKRPISGPKLSVYDKHMRTCRIPWYLSPRPASTWFQRPKKKLIQFVLRAFWRRKGRTCRTRTKQRAQRAQTPQKKNRNTKGGRKAQVP